MEIIIKLINLKFNFILFLLFVLNLNASNVKAQSFWRVYGGVNHSNILHILDGQPILYAHTLNAPKWNYGLQIGLDRVSNLNEEISVEYGCRFQSKGDKGSIKVIGQEKNHSIRLYEFMIPLNVKLKLLKDYGIYFKTGISNNVLMFQNKINGSSFFKIESFKDRLSISGQIGFLFELGKKLSIESMYSQTFTTIEKKYPVSFDGIKHVYTYKPQAFEITIGYKL